MSPGAPGAKDPRVDFSHLLTSRYRAYRHWAKETLLELDEEQLWTQWMLPDWPPEKIHPIASQLNHLWREATGVRQVLPETRAVIQTLCQRGYRLGVVSNTISRTDIPKIFQQIGLSDCIDAVILSGVFGKRKPDPAILLAAAEQLGVKPERCAYVGNHYGYDLRAARRAGFGSAIIISDSSPHLGSQETAEYTPDHIIQNLAELLEIFPPSSSPCLASLMSYSGVLAPDVLLGGACIPDVLLGGRERAGVMHPLLFLSPGRGQGEGLRRRHHTNFNEAATELASPMYCSVLASPMYCSGRGVRVFAIASRYPVLAQASVVFIFYPGKATFNKILTPTRMISTGPSRVQFRLNRKIAVIIVSTNPPINGPRAAPVRRPPPI